MDMETIEKYLQYDKNLGHEAVIETSYLLEEMYSNGTYLNGNLGSVATLNYIVNVYVDSLLCLFGFTGNGLTIYVLRQDKSKNSNNCLLQALAVYDILILLFTVFYTILRSVYPATGDLEAYHAIGPYIVAIGLPLGWIAQTGTVWFTTLVAADRYTAINFPFKAVRLCTYKNAVKVTLLTSLIVTLFNIPRFFHYYLVAEKMAAWNDSYTFVGHIKVELTGWNENLYHYLYHVGLTFLFVYITPLSLLVFFNTRLIAALKTAKQTQRRLSNVSRGAYKHNTSATLNMVVVITKFIVCQTPDFIAAIIGALPVAIQSDAYAIFLIFKEMLLVFNSSVNFYIYLVFNSKFRKIMHTNCCCCCSQASHHGSSYHIPYYLSHPKSPSHSIHDCIGDQDDDDIEHWVPSMAMKSTNIDKGYVNPSLDGDDSDSGIFGSREINMTPDPEHSHI